MPDPKDPRSVVTFQENQDYLERIAKAKGQQVPVGGAPMPQMPRLDQPVDPSARWAGVQNAQQQTRQTLSPEQMEAMRQAGVPLIPGVGAAYPFNQPALQGQQAPQMPQPPGQIVAPEGTQFANPPRQPGAGLRPETAAMVEAVAKANAAPGPVPTAAAAAKNAEEQSEADKQRAEAEKIKKELNEVEDEFDVDEFGNKVRSLFLNKERRDAIEKRCSPMTVEELIMNQEVRQTVPIIPQKLEPTYRSISASEDLWITRSVFGLRGSQQYIMDLLSAKRLCASLYSINGKPLPTHLDKDGEITDALFEAKMKLLMRYPIQMVADLSVNYGWFDTRVKKLLVIDEIKSF